MQEEPAREQDHATAPEVSAPSSSLLDELGRLVGAVRRLFGAQLHLLAVELGLARSAVSWLLVAALVATVAGVSLATWFHSWIWALLVLALLQALLLAGAIGLFRRCMHWMSLPATRHEWGAMMRETLHRAEREVDGESAGEHKP